MDFILYSEDIASAVNGETPNGEQLKLNNDVLIYFKLAGFEQPVLDRLRLTESNLQEELTTKTGVIYLGEMESVRAELHKHIDGLFESIKAYRQKELAKHEESPETRNP